MNSHLHRTEQISYYSTTCSSQSLERVGERMSDSEAWQIVPWPGGLGWIVERGTMPRRRGMDPWWMIPVLLQERCAAAKCPSEWPESMSLPPLTKWVIGRKDAHGRGRSTKPPSSCPGWQNQENWLTSRFTTSLESSFSYKVPLKSRVPLSTAWPLRGVPSVMRISVLLRMQHHASNVHT